MCAPIIITSQYHDKLTHHRNKEKKKKNISIRNTFKSVMIMFNICFTSYNVCLVQIIVQKK